MSEIYHPLTLSNPLRLCYMDMRGNIDPSSSSPSSEDPLSILDPVTETDTPTEFEASVSLDLGVGSS